MLKSSFRALAPVDLPYKGRQHYMHGFDLAAPVMLAGFEDYLEPIQKLIDAAGEHEGVAYMTVDEKIVAAGMSQRRPGPHVDGCFNPNKMDWQGGGGGWNHGCNAVPFQRMPIIVAASVTGCKAWKGEFDGLPTDTGCVAHIANQLDNGELLHPNMGYMLSPDCVHESLPFAADTRRTFLRIALPARPS